MEGLSGVDGKRRAGNIAKNEVVGRQRAERWFELKPCEICGNTKSERHHKDGNAKNNDISNIMFICRKHQQEIDGRMIMLKKADVRFGRKKKSEYIKLAEERIKPYLLQKKL